MLKLIYKVAELQRKLNKLRYKVMMMLSLVVMMIKI